MTNEEAEIIKEIPKEYKYDTETEDFLVYRHMYTGHEIHIEKPTPTYRLKARAKAMGNITRQEEIFIDEDNELHQTVKGMISDDYIERFKAEYKQLTIRLDKLNNIIYKAKLNSIEFKLNSSLELLEVQAMFMDGYASVLRDRAASEGINLD